MCPALAEYTADGYVAALQALIAQVTPELVFFPHTYQTRDFAPALAARLGDGRSSPTSWRTGHRTMASVYTRPVFQGKLSADVLPTGPAPHLVTFQIGAFRADAVSRGGAAAAVRAADL